MMMGPPPGPSFPLPRPMMMMPPPGMMPPPFFPPPQRFPRGFRGGPPMPFPMPISMLPPMAGGPGPEMGMMGPGVPPGAMMPPMMMEMGEDEEGAAVTEETGSAGGDISEQTEGWLQIQCAIRFLPWESFVVSLSFPIVFDDLI